MPLAEQVSQNYLLHLFFLKHRKSCFAESWGSGKVPSPAPGTQGGEAKGAVRPEHLRTRTPSLARTGEPNRCCIGTLARFPQEKSSCPLAREAEASPESPFRDPNPRAKWTHLEGEPGCATRCDLEGSLLSAFSAKRQARSYLKVQCRRRWGRRRRCPPRAWDSSTCQHPSHS